MGYIDVCNGDADGLFALHQWRLAAPCTSTLITGPKRDIALLQRASATGGDRVAVFDLSFEVNRGAVLELLHRGATIDYFDHHMPGEVPRHPNLRVEIDTSAEVCTSILVDRRLGGRYRLWAIAAAYGDNLPASAHRLAQTRGLDAADEARLRELGENVNYNAYGDAACDLMIAPDALYALLEPFENPFAFLAECPLSAELGDARRDDLGRAWAQRPATASASAAVYLLPDAPWARRVHGTFANALAVAAPSRAHAVLTPAADGSWTVSVRAPLGAPYGADGLCRRFGGAGRAGAAGISGLSAGALDAFAAACLDAFGKSHGESRVHDTAAALRDGH